jgi:hypothetical protein
MEAEWSTSSASHGEKELRQEDRQQLFIALLYPRDAVVA